jgi:hypothetical protein
MEAALKDLTPVKWKIDYDFYAINISSALLHVDYLDVIKSLLTQNLSYTLSYVTADAATVKTKIFNLSDIVGGSFELKFTYNATDHTSFKLSSNVTNSGAFGTLGAADHLGIVDTKHLIQGHPTVYALDGTSDFLFQPDAFVLSHAMDEIDGNPVDKNAGFFFGPTGLDSDPAKWSAFTKLLYSKTPTQIKSYIDAGNVPTTDTGGLGTIPFDKTCFVKVKEAFASVVIDDIVDHIDYLPDDNAGNLQMTIHFKDETAGDQPQILNCGLLAKNV